MELTKEHWNKKDIKEFQEYLKSFGNKDKKEWATNLLKTKLPVLCMATPVMKKIINEIYSGNYLEFLDLMIFEYYENTAINGFLITRIKDFNVMKKYLNIYSAKIDNWASCDLLAFDITGNEDNFFNLALEYINNDKPFVKRVGLLILFNFINDTYIDKLFEILNKFEKEDNYYVNMMIAWLLSECFIKERNKTLKYLKNNKLNRFALNKGIQKCRESNRVKKDDKDMILKFKKNKI